MSKKSAVSEWASNLPDLPKAGSSKLVAAVTFNKYAQALLDEWEARKSNPSDRRSESPNAWFKREAYRLLVHYVENGFVDVFQRVAKQDTRPNRLVEEAIKNRFKLGLLAMFSDESPLSRTNRHVFGNQMLYAWYHDVPPEFLNAFLAVSGGHEIISKKLKRGAIEPGFERRYRSDRLNI